MTGRTCVHAGVFEFIFLFFWGGEVYCLLDSDSKLYVSGDHTLRFNAEKSHCVL